jgi:hypothetical protein
VGPPEDDPDTWADGSLSLRHDGEAMKGDAVKRAQRMLDLGVVLLKGVV